LSYTQFLDALRRRTPGKLLAPVTVLAYAEPLRLSLSWAVSQGILARNPIQGYRWNGAKEHVSTKKLILGDADIADLEKASRKKPIRIPLLLALYGGLRREEVAALKWAAVDFARGAVHVVAATTATRDGEIVEKVVKTASSARYVSLPKFVMDELRAANASTKSDYVAVTQTGKRYSLYSYTQALQRIAKIINSGREEESKAPMPIPTFHGLRHTHAAMLIRNNVQPKVIQERLGHASITITMDTYGYLMAGLQEGVADVLEAYRNSSDPK
jgi:integrase